MIRFDIFDLLIVAAAVALLLCVRARKTKGRPATRTVGLVVVTIATAMLVFIKTATAYVHTPDVRNYVWAALSWCLLLCVAWAWRGELRRE